MREVIVCSFRIAIALLAFISSVGAVEHDVPPPGVVPSGWAKAHPPKPMAKRLKLIDPAAEGELRIVPTYCSCSVCWGVPAEIPGLKLECRPQDGDWQAAETPLYFADAKNYRGSLFYLKEDTAYELRLTAGGATKASGRFRTWSSWVPVAKTVEIDPATAKYPIRISAKGTPDGWIRYTVKAGKTLGRPDLTCGLVEIVGAAHVLLDDAVLCGGGGFAAHPILIEKSRGVRVRNCEISGWGRVGTPEFSKEAGGKLRGRGARAPIVNWDAAVMIGPGTSEITVERCYIHDPRLRANAWYYSHPAGPEGIFVNQVGHSVVLRWNDIVGSERHRWNDAIEGYDNFEEDGGFNRDADIYGNFCIFANDDCIELDGGMQNVRCFGNRMESALCPISIQGCFTSPVYVFDNLVAAGGCEFGAMNETIKTSTFDPYWYAPYAGVWGNYLQKNRFVPSLGPTSRFDFRDSNVVSSNPPPAEILTGLPQRDLPFVLTEGRFDGIMVTGMTAEPRELSFKAVSTRPVSYRVRQCVADDWYTVTPSKGVLNVGETAFKVVLRPERMTGRRRWRAAFVVRTAEGLSRCVSLYAERTDFAPAARPRPAGETTAYAGLDAPFRFDAAALAAGKTLTCDVSVGKDGNYWLFARVQGSGRNGTPGVDVSVDGAPFKRTVFWAWKDFAAWNLVTLDKVSPFDDMKGDPLVLKAGRHTVRFRPRGGELPFDLLDVAFSDDPLSFEPR